MEAKTTSDETVWRLWLRAAGRCWPASLLTLSSIKLAAQVCFFSDRIPNRGRLAVGLLQEHCITAQHEAIWFWGKKKNTLRWMDGLCATDNSLPPCLLRRRTSQQ